MSRYPEAGEAAACIAEAFAAFQRNFAEITRRAEGRFVRREWQEAQRDARERLLLHGRMVEHNVAEVRALLGEPPFDVDLGAQIKQAHAERVCERTDAELAETFYNSVIRRLFAVVGADPRIEYTGAYCRPQGAASASPPLHRRYPVSEVTPEAFRRILGDLPFAAHFQDLERDARLCAQAVAAELQGPGTSGIEAVEILPSLFYRNKGAYLVGRMRDRAGELNPLVFALDNGSEGIYLDAVLLTVDEASSVFGFTRSYFHVEVERPRAMIEFLRSLLPRKRINELYISIGYFKHGKTELYRDLMRHLDGEEARFEFAEGVRGMVMSVFTLPSYNVVFKVIKDRFGFPKETTGQAVREKYDMVFAHDRVGRLADAQEFEHLQLRRGCFSEALLEELLRENGGTVRVEGERVVIEHLYTERRVRPLDLFLREAEPDAAREAVLDYGYAIKDLAAANIFPGDLLLKNFGVTRHGRVIFYDYDELALLTECNFRKLPEPVDFHDEFAAEPWFHVGKHDVFPEEFTPFLIPPGPLRDAFLEEHADLLEVEFWKEMQERQAAGEVMDFFPYKPGRRLREAPR